ncbi:MAG: twin transmembrane helix small protein [Alphaproteobacteria bacterium]|nr:twin transmembrane helix small protein [Alphaproteobacteria bacterium]
MRGFLMVLIGLALAATLLVVLVGMIGMARGGEFNRRYGNKLMRLRVLAQFLALLLIAALFLVSHSGD